MKRIMLFVFLVLSLNLYASHDFIMGTGVVSQGFAGAGNADSGEPDIIFLNPSRITTVRSARLSLGFQIGSKDLKINNNSFEEGNFSFVTGGFIIPFSGKLTNLYFGLSATIPQPSIMYLYSQDPTYPQFINYRNMARYSFKPALSYRILNKFSIGAGVDIFGNSYGKAKISIDLANQKTTQSDFIMDQKFSYTPILGASYDHNEDLAFGLSYRFKNEFKLKIDTNFDMQLLNMNVIEDGQSFFVPAELTAGFKFKPTKRLKLLLDVGYVFFSDMPVQYVLINIEPSVLFPKVENKEKFSISSKDVMRIKFGAGYRFFEDRIEIRAGYQYFPTPIPDQIYNTNILDSDRHIFSTGLGFHIVDILGLIKDGIDLNIYFQYHYLTSRSFNKVYTLDKYGDYSIKGNIVEGGFGLSFSL